MSEKKSSKGNARTTHRLILNLLSSADEMSVLQVSEGIQLSKPTVMKIITRYVNQGLVLNSGKGSSTVGGGKRPSLFRFNKDAGTVLVFHIFPDELYSALTNLNSDILRSQSVPLSEGEGAEEFVRKAAQLYQGYVTDHRAAGGKLIGMAIGTHGITDRARGTVIYSPHFPRWGENFPLRAELQEKLGITGLLDVDNQIRYQAFAEKVKGIARGRKNIIVIEGGTGLVAGIIVKDEIKRGVHSLAGEIGHMILNPLEEEPCACGGKGCFEVMVSVKRLLRRARELSPRYPRSALRTCAFSNAADIESIFTASNAGDPLAAAVMDEASRWFAIGISNLILAYDPEMIVIQGVFVHAGDFFLRRVNVYVREVSLPHVKRSVEIAYSNLGRDAGIIGASAFVVQEYLRKLAAAVS
jgi:predicted NBD/HSP70 family sugar kinase